MKKALLKPSKVKERNTKTKNDYIRKDASISGGKLFLSPEDVRL